MEQAILDDSAEHQSCFQWARAIPIAMAAFILPIVFLIVIAQRRPSEQEHVRTLEAEAQAHARVALFETRKCQRSLQEFLLSPSPPPADWPPDGLAAYEELIALYRERVEQGSRYESVNERAAAGDDSPELGRELREIADEMTRYAQKASELQARVDAAERQYQEAHELARRLADEKQKRETGYGLGMTMEGYLFLKDGMSKYEVNLILDCTGEQAVQSGNLEICHWHQGFKRVHCTFRNGGLISKAQFGL